MDELYQSEGADVVWLCRIIQDGASLALNVIEGTGAGFFIRLFLFFFLSTIGARGIFSHPVSQTEGKHGAASKHGLML